MNTFLKLCIIFLLSTPMFLQSMSYQDIEARNKKLLEEEDKAIEPTMQAPIVISVHKTRDAPQRAEQKTPAGSLENSGNNRSIAQHSPCSCSINLCELALPLSCLLFLGLCAAGGTYCKQTKNCLYDSNLGTNSTTNSTVQFTLHTVMAPQNNTPMGYTKTKKYMLLKNKHRRTKKR